MSDNLSEATLTLLRSCSAATLTTALFKRGFRNTWINGVDRLTTAGGPMVGPAYTLRYIPAREDLDHLGVFEDREHPQRKAVEDIPAGCVLVMDCRGDGRAASAGAILLARMQIRGAAGVVTDGRLRDTPTIRAMDWPVYSAGASPPTNLIHHHAVDLNLPIACGGVAVYPGDILVGDGEGVVVIPRHLAAQVAEEAVEQERFEDFVMDYVRQGESIFGLYPPDDDALARYQASKKSTSGQGT